MKIIVLEGSPNKKGSTHILADCFRQGAEEAGHTLELLDVAHANIHPCTGCIRYTVVLLRYVRPAENHDRPLLCFQQFYPAQTYEIRFAGGSMEQ